MCFNLVQACVLSVLSHPTAFPPLPELSPILLATDDFGLCVLRIHIAVLQQAACIVLSKRRWL